MEQGLRIKVLELSAKETLCLNQGENVLRCDAAFCPYAKGFYDRLKAAVNGLSAYDLWDRDRLTETGRRLCLCPFELGLELSLSADLITGDYNYLFDPKVHIRRLFDRVGLRYAALLDEAHNLPDRSRRNVFRCAEALRCGGGG